MPCQCYPSANSNTMRKQTTQQLLYIKLTITIPRQLDTTTDFLL